MCYGWRSLSAFCASRSRLCWSSFRKDRPLLGGVIAFVESLLWCVRVQSSCVCVHFRVSSSTACVRVVPSGTFGTRSGHFRLGVRLLYFLLPSPFLRRQGICLRCTLERVLRVVQHPFERVVAGLSCSPFGRETLSDTASILNTTASNYFRALPWHLYRFGWV